MSVVAMIVVDANILAASPRLQSPEWLSLIKNLADWGLRIVVPEVVFMETVNVVVRSSFKSGTETPSSPSTSGSDGVFYAAYRRKR